MRRFHKPRLLVFLLIGFLSVFLTTCASAPSNTNSTPTPETTTSSPTPQSSPLTGFDKDDSAFLRTNAPQVVDWVITDEGKKVIAGTNFNLEEGNMDVLKKRFVVEDYSNK